MPHKRASYLNDSLLSEIAGRLKFGGQPIESKIEEIALPELVIKDQSHPGDAAAAKYGLRGYEYVALERAAMQSLDQEPALAEAYKRFLMLAKLKLPHVIHKVNAYEHQQAVERAKRASNYDAKLRARDHRVKQLTKSWTECRETVRTRWRKLERSYAAMLEKDSRLETMADRDLLFTAELQKRGVLEVAEGRVLHVDWTEFESVPIEEINEIVRVLNEDESGGFRPLKEPIL